MKRAPVSTEGWIGRATYRFGELCASIAKRLASPAAVPVSALILSRLDTVSPDQPLDEVAQLLVGQSLATVPVIDQGKPLGVVTRDALAGSLKTDSPQTPIGLVTLNDVIVVAPSDSIVNVRAQLAATPGAVALVLDNGHPVGMVTEGQIDEYLAQLETRRAA